VADATAPPARRDDAFELAEAATRELPASRLGSAVWPLVGWAAFAAGLSLFIFFGSVRVESGLWDGRRMRVSRIWSRFVEYLGEQGATPGNIALVSTAVAFALLGSLALVWLALRVSDQPPGHSTNSNPDS
jgi:hypothetical protein